MLCEMIVDGSNTIFHGFNEHVLFCSVCFWGGGGEEQAHPSSS